MEIFDESGWVVPLSVAVVAASALACATSSQNTSEESKPTEEVCDNDRDDDDDGWTDCTDKEQCQECSPKPAELATGKKFVCARSKYGVVVCHSNTRTVRLPLEKPLEVIDVGGSTLCGARDSGVVRCFDLEDQLTESLTEPPNDPSEMKPPRWTNASVDLDLMPWGVAVGERFACGGNRGLYCWGQNHHDVLGTDFRESRSKEPVELSGGNFQTVTAGPTHACATDDRNLAWCWGSKAYGQLARDDASVSGPSSSGTDGPAVIEGDIEFDSLAAGKHHTCGVTHDDEMYCWGRNHRGQLGIGEGAADNKTTPARVEGPDTWKEVTAGGNSTCALDEDDDIWCWGSNRDDQIRGHVSRTADEPVRVREVSGVRAVSAGPSQVCALDETRRLHCWGAELSESGRSLDVSEEGD